MYDLNLSLAKIPAHTRHSLYRHLLNNDGRIDAIKFAVECGGNLSELKAKFEETEEFIHNPPEGRSRAMKVGTHPRMYKDGYLAGLKDVIQIITRASVKSSEEFSLKVQPTLQSEALKAEARVDAFDFALKSQAAVPKIRTEILQIELHLSNLTNKEKLRDTEPKPRLYYESYLAGLKEAVRIIEDQSRESESTH